MCWREKHGKIKQLKQNGGDQGDMTTKCNIASWIKPRNKKKSKKKKMMQSQWRVNLVNTIVLWLYKMLK